MYSSSEHYRGGFDVCCIIACQCFQFRADFYLNEIQLNNWKTDLVIALESCFNYPLKKLAIALERKRDMSPQEVDAFCKLLETSESLTELLLDSKYRGIRL